MKKKKLATLLCALSLGATLTACSVDTSTSFTFRWNESSTNQVRPLQPGKDFYESYEYGVRLKHESGSNDDYSVNYQNGKYIVTLKQDPDDSQSYLLESTLTINVSYTFNGKTSETFNDSVHSIVKFKGNTTLRPTYSEKTVQCTSPVALSANSLEDCYRSFHYKTTTTYNEKCSSGVYTQEDLGAGTVKNEKKTFSISSKRSYLDNEQLIFALRGITSSNDESIFIFDAGSKQTRTVNITQGKTASDTFKIYFNENDLQDYTIDYIPFSISFSGNNPGATQNFFVAKYKEGNKYRNMILKMESPLSFNLGTLEYNLQKAYTFDE